MLLHAGVRLLLFISFYLFYIQLISLISLSAFWLCNILTCLLSTTHSTASPSGREKKSYCDYFISGILTIFVVLLYKVQTVAP